MDVASSCTWKRIVLFFFCVIILSSCTFQESDVSDPLRKTVIEELSYLSAELASSTDIDSIREKSIIIEQSSDVSDIYISEICTNNKASVYDDNGNYGSDYVEIYNGSEDTVNLKGYRLTDRLEELDRFIFPEIDVLPHSAIIVWQSASTDSQPYNSDYKPVDVHGFGFGLKGGDCLSFLNRSGDFIQSVKIPNILEGMVYASSLEYPDQFRFCSPSPYFVEDAFQNKLPIRSSIVAPPFFSVTGGWFDHDIMVSLSSPNGTIYYTLDGTTPTSDSALYTEPIRVINRSNVENLYSNIEGISLLNTYLPTDKVDKGTVIKAISVLPDGSKSKVVSETYFVGLEPHGAYRGVSVMEITVEPADFFDYEKGIYVLGKIFDTYSKKFSSPGTYGNEIYSQANYAKEGNAWERPAKIEYYSEDHKRVFEQEIGIRIHGGWSVAHNQKGFNLYAREKYDGNNAFQFDFFGSPNNKIMLRPGGFRDVYITKIRDVFNQSLVADRRIGTQAAIPCAVFLNGEYWGLYNLQETIGTKYIKERYGVEESNVLIMKNNQTNTSPEDAVLYNDVVQYAVDHNLSDQDNYDHISSLIDIQSYIDYYCFEIYIANCDAIANNYARWRSISKGSGPYEDCRWRWLCYDTDDSAGMVYLSRYTVDSFVQGHWALNPLGDQGDALFSNLMENSIFKQLFVTSFCDMVNSNYQYDIVHKKLVELSNHYRDAVVASHNRFRGNYSISGYNDSFSGIYDCNVFAQDISIIDEFYKNRSDYILRYMKEDLELQGELKSISIHNEGAPITVKINTVLLNDFSGEWTGNYYSDYSVELSLEEIPENFLGWKINGKLVLPQNTLSIELSNDVIVDVVYNES